jgi:hypothetical protein
MRMRRATYLFVFAAAFVFVCAGLAADIARAQSPAPPGTTGNYVIRIAPKSLEVVKAIVAHDIEVLAVVKGGYLDLLVKGSADFDFVRSLGQPFSVIQTPEMMERAAAALGPNLDRYHTYLEMQADLNALVAAYPSLASLGVMGQSIYGKNIYVLKISDNVSVDENEPEVLYMGNHHARELMSVEIPLMFAKYLLANYGSDPDVTAMVNNREIFIAPMINPDGHVYVELNHSNPDPNNWWRKNRRDNGLGGGIGVDLNRNYGYMWGYDDNGSSPDPNNETYRGTGPFSEPETQAVRDFCAGRNIILALSYHSYGEDLLFPWGYAPIYTPDHALFQALGDTLAFGTGYDVGTSPEVLYLVNGDSDDWAYGETVEKPRFFCFTPEVNSSDEGGFAPDTSYIQPTFNFLLPMNMTLLHFADNPYRLNPPSQPVQYAIDDSNYPFYTVRWAPIVPPNPNPALDYDVEEYRNISTIAQDGANSVSPLWTFDGFSVSTARKFEGTGSYFSGAQNLSSHTLQMATFYHVSAETDSFRFRTWYSIESDYDYAYLEASTDGGTTWATVPGNITTNFNPNGTNMGNGITGSSGGWVQAIFPLTAYTGSDLDVRFLYRTDQAALGEGMYVDLPGPVSTCEARTVVASALPDTSLAITPHEEARFAYRIRARDYQDQRGPWSASQSITIDNVTAIGDTPVLASALGANYPNPFNPTTRIPYTVGGPVGSNRLVDVTLRIYNVAGERVATLVKEPRTPGRYEAIWSGRTDSGGEVSSGVYFARLTVAGAPQATRKLVLLK